MARDESDREDLLREATALVERIELRSARALETSPANIVVGFRDNGAASFFFDSDPVYQFNTSSELRRAFCDGVLFKAVSGRLVALERVRQPNQVQLRSQNLTEVEQESFMAGMRERLRGLATDLESRSLQVVGQVPHDIDVLSRVNQWLASCDCLPIAASPRVL